MKMLWTFVFGLLVACLIVLSACGSEGEAQKRDLASSANSTAATLDANSSLGIGDLQLQSGGNLVVTSKQDFGVQFKKEKKYLEMFGRSHEQMSFYAVRIGSDEGSVTLVEFASVADAEAALKTAEGQVTNRPTNHFIVGRVVAMVQSKTGSLDAFAEGVKAALVP